MEWAQPFQQTMDCDMIEAKFQWFLGGTLNASGKNFILGTIPVIRQHIFGLYLTHSLTHPPYVRKNSTERQQKWQFF